MRYCNVENDCKYKCGGCSNQPDDGKDKECTFPDWCLYQESIDGMKNMIL